MEAEAIGELALLDDGTWSYVSELPLPAQAGGLLLLTDGESKERHVFGVTTVTSWGAVLGRLDRNPISPRLRGSFGPATAVSCKGSANQRTCVDKAPEGTWFSVFETSGDKLIIKNGVPSRIGRIRAGDPSSDLWAKKGNDWVAIVDRIGPPARSLRVGLSNGCQAQKTTFHGVDTKMPGQHPLDVENQAYEDMVDGFVSCAGTDYTVAIPAAGRPLLKAPDIRLRTHPVLVVGENRIFGNLDDVGRFAAMVGIGDFDGAGLLLLKLAEKNPKIALQGAEILAAAGRPDEALALAFEATKTAWNRDGDFYWVFLRARVALALGDEASFVERWSRLPDMAQRLENNGVYGWMVWQAFMAEFKGVPEYESYDESLKGREFSKWRALLRLTSALRTRDDSEVSAFSSISGDAKALAQALRGENVPKKGEGPLDVYGRLWASGVRGDLTHVGGAEFRPGYSHRPPDINAFEVLNLNRILGRTPSVDELKIHLACDAAALPATQGLALDPVAVWALTSGRTAACKGPEVLLQVVSSLDKAERGATRDYVVAFFEQLLATHNDAGTLSSAGVWASLANLGESCRSWNLSLGFSALVADRLDDAQAALVRANGCSTRQYATSEKQLAAAVNWLRTGRVSGDFDAPIRDAVHQITRQKTTGCPLTADWDVHLAELAEPAIGAHLVAMEQMVQEDFSVVTSLQHLKSARSDIPVFVAAIQGGDSMKAAKTLQNMKAGFRAARHLPGQRFVDLLEQVVFDGRLDDFITAAPAKNKDKSVGASLRSGKSVNTKGWTPSQLRVGEFLTSGDLNAILKAPASDFSAELCALPQPRSNDGPIDLDADF